MVSTDSRASVSDRTKRRWARFVWLAVLVAGCAVPGHVYRVSPPVMGTIDGVSSGAEEIELVLSIMHRENPTLFDRQQSRLTEDGRFYFEPVALEIAGREYSKFYRAFLHARDGDEEQLIWRGEFSRKDLRGRVQLDCVLTRRPRVSQPCRVIDPLSHPWLTGEGERSFQRLCARCHGDGGTGGTANAPGAPDLTRIAARRDGRFDPMEVAERIEGSQTPIQHGPTAMPAWGERLSAEYWRYANRDRMTGATIDPIVVYLQSIQRGAAR